MEEPHWGARCEDCGLPYGLDSFGQPDTDYPYTCDDCGGYVDLSL